MKLRLEVVGLTFIVMIAFAANSVIGRAALKSDGGQLIDPATYSTVRVIAGALVLVLIQLWRRRRSRESSQNEGVSREGKGHVKRPWLAASMLTLYAVGFSFAYVRLDAASGTLILFAFVQITMVSLSAIQGEKPGALEIVGLLVAFGGLIYLLAPSEKSAWRESGLMMLSGIGWGVYSVLGKKNQDSIAATASNFLHSVPMVLLVSLFAFRDFATTSGGLVLAALSGGVTSGLGYVLWYVVLPHLRSTQAAVAQLSVPVLTAVGGVLFAGDSIDARKIVSGLIILGGIAIVGQAKR